MIFPSLSDLGAGMGPNLFQIPGLDLDRARGPRAFGFIAKQEIAIYERTTKRILISNVFFLANFCTGLGRLHLVSDQPSNGRCRWRSGGSRTGAFNGSGVRMAMAGPQV